MSLALGVPVTIKITGGAKRQRWLIHPDDWKRLAEAAATTELLDEAAAFAAIEFTVSPLAKRGYPRPLPD